MAKQSGFLPSNSEEQKDVPMDGFLLRFGILLFGLRCEIKRVFIELKSEGLGLPQ
jgi:hypothetical protein